MDKKGQLLQRIPDIKCRISNPKVWKPTVKKSKIKCQHGMRKSLAAPGISLYVWKSKGVEKKKEGEGEACF